MRWKRAGCTDIISLSAVGSLNGDLPPGTFVIVDQFIDRTFARKKTFFETGCVAHVSMAHPVCPRLGDALESACRQLGLKHKRGGTYLVMEGPQFSTKAESELYRAWGCDVIGMTNMPEAKLAREAELCYATVGDGDGFRLLAPRPRPCDGGGGGEGAVRERRPRAGAGEGGGAGAGGAARPLPGGLRPRSGGGDHHRPREARPGADGEAGCGGGAGC